MKKVWLLILMLVLTASLFVSLSSCEDMFADGQGSSDGNGGDTGDNSDGNNGGNDSDSGDGNSTSLEGLVLIENKIAKFQIVYTGEAGSSNVKLARELVNQLRALGITVNDPILEGSNAISDCEIIVGTGAKHRGEEFNVTARELGKSGMLVKTVGQKVLIAGGTAEITARLFKDYIENQMKIDENTVTLTNLAVNDSYYYHKETNYRIDTIKISNVDLSKYVLVYDLDGMDDYGTSAFKEFREKIYDISGCYLDEGEADEASSYDHAFIIRCTDDAGENGFRAYVDGKDFVIECAYKNAFENAFLKFADKVFYSNSNNKVILASNYEWTDNVSCVRYSDFGAKGDGATDDFAAILATHEYANEGGQTVLADDGAVYYIYPKSFVKTIPVKTNVDFKGATFIIDDVGSLAWANKNLSLFTIARDYEVDSYGINKLTAVAEEIGATLKISPNQEKIEWLVPYLKADSMVKIVNGNHRDYVRYGSNQSSGERRREVLLVSLDGTVSNETPVFFDYETITELNIYRIDDDPITFENGIFYNICCRTVSETDYMVKYNSYNRGIRINRSNVTIQNVKHRMMDEPDYGISPDGKNQGDYMESYPYNRGFYYVDNTYNLLIKDGEIAGHTTYYEKKATTESSGDSADGYNYVPAGSYDFVVEESTHITFDNVKQYNVNYHIDEGGNITALTQDTGIGDERYWGIMSSNFARNLFFYDCSISRIDAHMGFFNLTVKDTEIGHTFHAVGGGTLYAENVTKLTGDTFLVTRGDYGGTFKGDMIFKNCELKGYNDYNSSKATNNYLDVNSRISKLYVLSTEYFQTDNTADKKYWNWDFGYDCYMPITVTFEDSFKHRGDILYFSRYDFSSYYTTFALPKMNEDPTYVPYQLTKEIIYKNWHSDILPINKNSSDPDNYMTKELEKGIKIIP